MVISPPKGVAGPEDKDDDDFLNAARIGENDGQIVSELKVDEVLAADEASEKGGGALHDLIQGKRLIFEGLLPAVVEKLADQVGRSSGEADDSLERGVEGGFVSWEAEAGVGMTCDDGECPAEVGGQAGGELADDFHFAGVAQINFQFHAVRDVLEDEDVVRLATEEHELCGEEGFAEFAAVGADFRREIGEAFSGVQAGADLFGGGGGQP